MGTVKLLATSLRLSGGLPLKTGQYRILSRGSYLDSNPLQNNRWKLFLCNPNEPGLKTQWNKCNILNFRRSEEARTLQKKKKEKTHSKWGGLGFSPLLQLFGGLQEKALTHGWQNPYHLTDYSPSTTLLPTPHSYSYEMSPAKTGHQFMNVSQHGPGSLCLCAMFFFTTRRKHLVLTVHTVFFSCSLHKHPRALFSRGHADVWLQQQHSESNQPQLCNPRLNKDLNVPYQEPLKWSNLLR